jgi:hypothetical protein
MEHLLIHIAQRDKIAMIVFDVAFALAVKPDLRDADISRVLRKGTAGQGQA